MVSDGKEASLSGNETIELPLGITPTVWAVQKSSIPNRQTRVAILLGGIEVLFLSGSRQCCGFLWEGGELIWTRDTNPVNVCVVCVCFGKWVQTTDSMQQAGNHHLQRLPRSPNSACNTTQMLSKQTTAASAQDL